jgi:hypothetical protein
MSTGLFTCYTLVDITQTGVIRPSDNPELGRQRNQQRNYETLIQILSLRSLPILRNTPKMLINQQLDNYNFGDHFEGSHNVWEFTFEVEQEDVFLSNNNPAGLLESDINHVPIIVGLAETASFVMPMFSSSYDTRNIYFELR